MITKKNQSNNKERAIFFNAIVSDKKDADRLFQELEAYFKENSSCLAGSLSLYERKKDRDNFSLVKGRHFRKE